MDLVTYGLALLEGTGLILSPCILPILPIVLSIGIEGPKGRPYGTIVGFIASFSILTLLSRQLITGLGIDLETIRFGSFCLLGLFGLVLISDRLSEFFSRWTSSFANLGERIANKQTIRNGFLGGLILGLGIGAIWVPCAGPIMAAVIVQTITQKTTLETGLTLLSFTIGAAVPMLILVLMGRCIMDKVSFLKSHTHFIRRTLGIIILMSVAYSSLPTKIWSASSNQSGNSNPARLLNGVASPYPAPPIEGISQWINSPPLRLEDLKGKVILIDFWTYSCINCVRTLPYLKKWDALYRDKGLVIIGIHSPEFAFEHDFQNVQQAVNQFQIQYAVALDNNFQTWTNFQNHYWPAHYLIDKEGRIVYVHYGEGNYDVTESNILFLLGMGNENKPIEKKDSHGDNVTPETYLGFGRSERFAKPSALIPDQQIDYPTAKNIPLHGWSLEGKWTAEKQRIIAGDQHGEIILHFKAKHVFLVLGSRGRSLQARVMLDEKPLRDFAGADVKNDIITVNKDRLYDIASFPSPTEGIIKIKSLQPGLEAYAFTFG